MNFEEFLSNLMANMGVISMQSEQNKTNFNVMFRILYEKGIFTENDILESFKKEYKTLKELGAIEEIPDDNMMNLFKDNIILWLKGDSEEIKRKVIEMRKMAQKNNNSSKIDIVGADALNVLNNASKKSGGKIIL